ncbi:hypothetical protein ACFQX6_25160 [Streptosporangium lutulentum]
MSETPATIRLTPRTALSHARTAARLTLKAAPWSLALLAVLAVAAGLAPVATAWLSRLVLDGLVDGMGGPALVWLAVTLALVGIATVILPRLSQYAEAELGRRVRVIAVDRLYTAMNQRLRGLTTLEDPRFHDRIRLAQQGGSVAPGDLVNSATGIGRGALTLTGFLVTLLLVNPWLVLAVAVASIPTVRAEILMGWRRMQAMWRIGHAERRQYFYANLLSSPRRPRRSVSSAWGPSSGTGCWAS